MINILRIVVIIMVTSGLTTIIYKDRKIKSQISDNDKIILKLPRLIFWIGIVTVAIFGILLILSVTSTLTETSNDDIFNIVVMIIFFLASALMASAGAFWKLEFRKDEEYFDYCTCFDRKYKIFYEDVKRLSVSGSTVSIRVKGHRFLISSISINYEKFAKFVNKKVTPVLPKGGSEKEGALRRALEQLKDPIDIIVGLAIISGAGVLGGFLGLYVLLTGNYVEGQEAIGIVLVTFFFAAGIGVPIVTVYSINHRDKHPLLFRLCVKRGMLKEDEYKNRKRNKKSKKH